MKKKEYLVIIQTSSSTGFTGPRSGEFAQDPAALDWAKRQVEEWHLKHQQIEEGITAYEQARYFRYQLYAVAQCIRERGPMARNFPEIRAVLCDHYVALAPDEIYEQIKIMREDSLVVALPMRKKRIWPRLLATISAVLFVVAGVCFYRDQLQYTSSSGGNLHISWGTPGAVQAILYDAKMIEVSRKKSWQKSIEIAGRYPLEIYKSRYFYWQRIDISGVSQPLPADGEKFSVAVQLDQQNDLEIDVSLTPKLYNLVLRVEPPYAGKVRFASQKVQREGSTLQLNKQAYERGARLTIVPHNDQLWHLPPQESAFSLTSKTGDSFASTDTSDSIEFDITDDVEITAKLIPRQQYQKRLAELKKWLHSNDTEGEIELDRRSIAARIQQLDTAISEGKSFLQLQQGKDLFWEDVLPTNTNVSLFWQEKLLELGNLAKALTSLQKYGISLEQKYEVDEFFQAFVASESKLLKQFGIAEDLEVIFTFEDPIWHKQSPNYHYINGHLRLVKTSVAMEILKSGVVDGIFTLRFLVSLAQIRSKLPLTIELTRGNNKTRFTVDIAKNEIRASFWQIITLMHGQQRESLRGIEKKVPLSRPMYLEFTPTSRDRLRKGLLEKIAKME